MQRFKNILLVIDKRVASKSALEQAVALCKRNQAHLTVVDIVEDLSPEAELWLTPDMLSAVRSQELEIRQNRLKHLVEPFRQDALQMDIKVLSDTPFLAIIREVLRFNHDLVIMTADGDGGLRERLFGSTSMHLMRKCPCPVWVIKPNHPPRYTRILAAVDPASFDDSNGTLDSKIMDLATSLTQRQQAELHIVHAWFLSSESTLIDGRSRIPKSDAKKILRFVENKHKDELNKLLVNYDLQKLNYKVHLLKGVAKDIIPTIAQENEIDLIVMGTVARTGIAGFFIGNTAENVLSQVNCSVLTVKPDKFITPVKLEN